MNPIYVGVLAILAVIAGIIAVLVMTRLKFPTAWIRKLSHLGSTTLVIIVAFLFGFKLFILVGVVFAILLLGIKIIHPPKALTTKEARDSYGEVFFFIGVTITALIASSVWDFVVPVAILGLADTAAYVVGRSVVSPKLIFSKTVAGSLAFMVIAFFLLMIVAPWWAALIGAVVTSVAELVGLRGSDNITVPVVAVLLLTIT